MTKKMHVWNINNLKYSKKPSKQSHRNLTKNGIAEIYLSIKEI